MNSNLDNKVSVALDFNLKDVVTGELVTLEKLKGENGTVIMIICNHCPFVVHVIDEIVRIAEEYQQKGVSFVAISSNDVESYPQDGLDKMKELAEMKNFTFPYLYDETQEVAKSYGAVCTPEFYVFDSELNWFYHGQLDDSRPGNGKELDGKDLRMALDDLIAGRLLGFEAKPSVGCSIKWK